MSKSKKAEKFIGRKSCQMTRVELDAIAVKLLGWKAVGNRQYIHQVGKYGVLRNGLDPKSGADAMLVLEAMGEKGKVAVESNTANKWRCYVGDDATDITMGCIADTLDQAIFACAGEIYD